MDEAVALLQNGFCVVEEALELDVWVVLQVSVKTLQGRVDSAEEVKQADGTAIFVRRVDALKSDEAQVAEWRAANGDFWDKRAMDDRDW